MKRLGIWICCLGAAWGAAAQELPEFEGLTPPTPTPAVKAVAVDLEPEPAVTPVAPPAEEEIAELAESDESAEPAASDEPAEAEAVALETVAVTVLGDRVNLRTDTTLESDVVGQANYGDILQALTFEDKWVEVLPPAGFTTWVYGPLLYDDREVRAPELNVRSGPGTEHSRVGQLTRGTPVTVIESLGDWRKIAPPPGVTVWISREFIEAPPSVAEVAEAPVPTPTPRPVPTPVTVVEVRTVEKIVEVPVPATPTPEPQVEAPEGLNLVPLRGQGTLSKRRGTLRGYLLAAGAPSRFSLVGGDDRTLCYLIGDEEMLKAAVGQRVQVAGRDYWVTGEKLPVTKVEDVLILGEDP